MPGKRDKPVMDVKHVLRKAYLEEYDEFLYRVYVIIPPYGKVRILIKKHVDDQTLAQLVMNEGAEREWHPHYGKIHYDYIEGHEIIRAIREYVNEEKGIHPLVGLDGWLRLSGDDEDVRQCIFRGVESECFYYIKVHEMVIFPPVKK
jgi:hypothetical protein